MGKIITSSRSRDLVESTEIPMRRVTFTVPICSVCNREVEKFEMVRKHGGEQTKLVAHCHGSTSESEWFKEEELDRLYSWRAFMSPKREKRKFDFRDTDATWFDPRLIQRKR